MQLNHEIDANSVLDLAETGGSPRLLVKDRYHALRPGERLTVVAPHAGYVSNLARAIVGRLDEMLWSRRALVGLVQECGFEIESAEVKDGLPLFRRYVVVVARKR